MPLPIVTLFLYNTSQKQLNSLPYFTESEVKLHDSYKDPNRQEQFRMGRALIREKVSKTIGCSPESIVIKTTPEGKPFIEGNPIYFNLTHSGPYIGLVVSNHEVGIDIQQPRKVPYLELAKRFYTPENYTKLLNTPESNQKELFFQLWTEIESIQKCLGKSVFNNKLTTSKTITKSIPFASDSLYGSVTCKHNFKLIQSD